MRRFANGGVNAAGLASLRGTVVHAPTVFRYAPAVARWAAGEGGSEAILPLKRDGSGRLGVSAGNWRRRWW
jgi:phage-related minor tail protein